MIPAHLKAAVEDTLSKVPGKKAVISAVIRAAGGCINQGALLTTSAGARYFLKWNDQSPPRMFTREAEGLNALAKADCKLTIPQVVAVQEKKGHLPAFILMTDVNAVEGPGESGKPDELLGRGLARLHRTSAKKFGFAHDNFIGPTPQTNSWSPIWPEFFASQRLEPMVRLLADTGSCPLEIKAGARRLLERLPALLQTSDAVPSLVHGDLWSGNVIPDASGSPALIDPACYYGHREVDLAMMQLFGGFSPRVFDAYDELYPRADGHAQRSDVYNLYHVLNHALLFGGGYVAQAAAILRRYA